MGECRVHDSSAQTRGDGRRGATAHVPNPLRSGNQGHKPRKKPYSWRNIFSSDDHSFKGTRSHREDAQSHSTSVDAASMASTEKDGLETSNTSICEGHQQPLENNGAPGQNKHSLTKSFQSLYHIHNNPTTPNLPDQPTTPRPISNEDSKAATPNPIYQGGIEGRDLPISRISQFPESTTNEHIKGPIIQHSTVPTGPLLSAISPEHIAETGGTVDIVGEARSTTDAQAAELPLEEDYELIPREDMSRYHDYCNKNTDLDWVFPQNWEASEFERLIPHSPISVEPQKVYIEPPDAKLQRAQKLRLDVRRLRRDIQNHKLLLDTQGQQLFNENDEFFNRLREFVAEHHKQPDIHDSILELLDLFSKLFSVLRTSRDERGPLNDKIRSLEEKLAFEEIQLTEAENNLHESLGMLPMDSEEAQGDGISKSELPISEGQHTSANHTHNAEGKDGGFDLDAYSTGSFEETMTDLHPLYIQLEWQRGTRNNLYERRAHQMSDLVNLQEELESRERVNLHLLPDNRESLDNLPEIIRLLDFEVDQSQREIDKLRTQCLEQGIIDENDNYIYGGGEASDDSDTSSDSTAPPLPPLPSSARPRQAVQTQPPQITTAPNAIVSKATTARTAIVSNLGAPLDELSYQNRINPWLLGKLAVSRMELSLLATILSAVDGEPDVASVLDVLKLWDHDGAGMEPPQRVGKLDEVALNRIRSATNKVVGDGFDRALVSSLFGLSLWGGGPYVEDDESAYLDDI
ncbi:hypothetical protein V494_02787 [Pseudogymnoascus sp. VKM F-4513 (FW-928)]|nr:hypothetical protein V494_02787 [Pseudogymnoascus sp. VKM F-4513 (FW-928)]